MGTLQDQLTYPNTSNSEQLTPEDLTDILRQVDLEYLVSREGVLDTEINWEEELSLGEAQRLAIARLIRARPAFAILDVSGAKRPASARRLCTQSALCLRSQECTSAVSTEMENRLYRIANDLNIS